MTTTGLDYGAMKTAATAAEPTTIRTICTYCGVGDPVRVVDGKLKADGPLGVCVKGARFLESNQGTAARPRIRRPQIKGWLGWREVSWEQAYAHIARRLLSIRRRHGRQSVAYYGVGQLSLEAMWLSKKLFQGYLGTNNVGSNAELCLAASAGGHELVFGNEGSFACYEDYLHADAILLYGSNQLINHPTIFERYLLPNAGAIKVVIDPRETETTRAVLAENPERNMHVRLRSRGDVLLNLAIAHELFADGLIAEAYLERHVEADSLRELKALVASEEHSADAAARRIAVSDSAAPALADQIRRLARIWAERKVATTSSVGINQTSGSEGVATILNLHLLTANLGEPGRGHVRLAGQSNASSELAMGFNCKLLPFRLKVERRRDRVRMSHLWDTQPWSIHPERGVNVTDYPRADHLRFFFMQGTDFVRNFPDLDAWHDKLRRSFVVACDPFEVPGVREFADVLLPVRTHAESDGTYLNGERRFQPLRAVSAPPAGVEARSDVTLLVELSAAIADRLVPMDQQLTDVNERYLENRQRSWWSALLPWDDRRRYDDGAPELADIHRRVRQGNRDLDPRPILRNFANNYGRDAQGEVLISEVWSEVQRASQQMYNEFSDGEGQPISWQRLSDERDLLWGGARRYLRGETNREDGDEGAIFERRFKSELGRARLVIPRGELRAPVPVGGDRFNLITGRGTIGERSERYGIGVFNSGVKAGAEAEPPARHPLFVHPEDAARMGIAAGDRLRVTSRVGALEREAALSEAVPPGHLFLSFYPDGERGTPNRIVPSDSYCPHVFQPTIKVLEVTLERLT